MPEEILISVDVETGGPIPGEYPLLSIGACLVQDRAVTFYIELIPDRERAIPEALAISGLDMNTLKHTGVEPGEAMKFFAAWVRNNTPEGARPVFVALNAPFDWMFINDYFHRYLGENPFGHSALDIKAYFMGQAGVSWSETSFRHLTDHFLEERRLTHNALRDAQDQAEIFAMLLKQNPRENQPE
jgi:ribonuclease T